MKKKERHIEALSPECEAILAQRGMHSLADHKDETDAADIYSGDDDLVLSQVPRDIPPYYLTRLIEACQQADGPRDGNQLELRAHVDSEIDAFRKRLKAIRDHYGAQEGAAAWVEIEDKARRAFVRLGRARDALDDLSDEVAGVEKWVRQMVAIEREHNVRRGRSGHPEVSICHDLLEDLSSSAFRKLS